MVKMTLKVDGMMCGMCESHVSDTFRKAFGQDIVKVTSNKNKKQTVILANNPIPEQALADALAPTGYSVTGYTCEPYEKKGLFHFGH